MDDERNAPEESAQEPAGSGEESKELKKAKRRRRRWPIILLIVFGVIFLLAFGFYEYSNTSQFCNSCHIMKPYYDAWASSSHNDVSCTECHISPEDGAKWDAKIQGMLQVFKYVTRTYSSKPYAEIEDSSCLRSGCHGKRLVEARSTEEFKTHVVFDHRPHLTQVRRGRQLRCTSCHAQIVIGTHMEVTTTTCYLCHFRESPGSEQENLSACRQCHRSLPDENIEHNVNDPMDRSRIVNTVSFNHADFIADRDVDCRSCHTNAVQGSGEAKRDRCIDCHNIPEHLARFDDVEFIHDNHITEHNVTCERCHEAIRHEVVTHTLGVEQACNRCHSSTHSGQRNLYLGIGGRSTTEPMPSLKYSRMVDCSGCHYGEVDTESGSRWVGFSRKISREGCDNCHGDEGEDYWEAFQDYIGEVKDRLAEVKTVLARARGATSDEAMRAAIELAAHDLELIERAQGWAHNWEYSTALLDAIEERLESSMAR